MHRTYLNYVVKERSYDEIPQFGESRPEFRAMAYQVDLKRSEDPLIVSKIAAQEIYVNIKNMLKNEKGVHAETLLAVIASMGGRLCVHGIMDTVEDMVSLDASDRKKILYVIASVLQIVIVESRNGDAYILGDRIENEFMMFYNNSIAENGDLQRLLSISRKTAELVG